jgi:hypothetical protein
MTWKTLTVAEDDMRSDRLTARYTGRYKFRDTELRVSITDEREFTVSNQVGIVCTPGFSTKDIDELILFLQDAKVFLEEEEVMKKLQGETVWQ